MFTYETFTIRRNGKHVEFRIGDSSVVLSTKVAELVANKIIHQARKIESENNSENHAAK